MTDESRTNLEETEAKTQESSRPKPKRENLLLNIGLNVIIPSFLMTKGKDWFGLQPPALLMVIALAFPIAYGIYDFVARKKYNFFSIIGFASILITGSVGLLELNKDWIAVKEAAIPALFGIAVLVSLKTPFPLVRTLLYSPEIFDVPKIESTLWERGNQSKFERLMVHCTLYMVASFALSTILNYAVAKYFIHSETGTEEFVKEVGRMTAWSWLIIAVPSTAVLMVALLKLVKGIKELTGFDIEDVMLVGHPPEKKD